MKTKTIAFATLAVVAAATLNAPAASADDRICRGRIGATTVDNLKVPQGANCELDGTRVEGNVIVNEQARLVAVGVRVDGNVQSEGHRKVVVRDSIVGGSIQLKQGKGLRVVQNKVDSDIQIFSNKAGDDVIRIAGNRVGGNLQCKSNSPRPTGTGNIVQGNKEDQCKGL